METINYECYVSFEIAKLLKKAGFNWEVKSYRKGLNGIFETTSIPDNFNDGTLTDWISAPTLNVAQRWLREEKNIEPVPWRWPTKVIFVEGYKPWTYKITFYRDLEHVDIDDINVSGENYFRTYEEAQEAGIKKVLELILEKGK